MQHFAVLQSQLLVVVIDFESYIKMELFELCNTLEGVNTVSVWANCAFRLECLNFKHEISIQQCELTREPINSRARELDSL